MNTEQIGTMMKILGQLEAGIRDIREENKTFDEHDKRLSRLERQNSWLLGAGTVIGGLIALVIEYLARS